MDRLSPGPLILPDRAVVSVAGEDAEAFLQNLLTCSVSGLQPGRAAYGGLLSPQGKILFDFVILHGGDAGYLFDLPTSLATDFVRRLGLYKLRARVQIKDLSTMVQVCVGTEAAEGALAHAPDPRHPDLGHRSIVPNQDTRSSAPSALKALDDRRVTIGVPEGGKDFRYGDAFPHEADMDQFGGVDFKKGCYVGQEIVSRMQHRGTARTRIVPILAPTGTELVDGSQLMAGDRIIGTVSSACGFRALATIRLDKLADAVEAGRRVLAGEAAVSFVQPSWASFTVPGGIEAT